MLVITKQYLCDACGKDVTDTYKGTIAMYALEGDDVILTDKMFCKECMESFQKWFVSRKAKGHWIEHGDYECSLCGTCYPDLHPEYGRTPFCPHCGAEMEEGDGE